MGVPAISGVVGCQVAGARCISLRVNISSGWQFWIDRGGTFTDVIARIARGLAGHVEAPFRRSRAVPRRRRGGDSPRSPSATARTSMRGSKACGWAPRSRPMRSSSARRTHRARHHRRVSRCATDRLPESAGALRPAHPPSGVAVLRGDRSARAPDAAGACSRALGCRGIRALSLAQPTAVASDSAAIAFLHGYRYYAARASRRRDRARDRLSPGVRLSRSRADSSA